LTPFLSLVMAGLGPAIHDFARRTRAAWARARAFVHRRKARRSFRTNGVDGRDKPGHDDGGVALNRRGRGRVDLQIKSGRA
jgi:hypothetical protein